MVSGGKFRDVKAHFTDQIGEAGSDRVIRGAPGGMIPHRDDADKIVGFHIACPRCGVWGGISFVETETFKNPWRVTGGNVEDVTTLSVMNSILKHCCGYHGYLVNGVFVACEDCRQ